MSDDSNQRADEQPPAPAKPQRRAYQRPELRKYGSLAALTRSGTGTLMENNMGPNRRFQ